MKGHDICIEVLLSAGANRNLGNMIGSTPLDVAIQMGHDKCVELLLSNQTSEPSAASAKPPQQPKKMSKGARPKVKDQDHSRHKKAKGGVPTFENTAPIGKYD